MMGMDLVQRSIYGGILILIILAVRVLLLDKLPKRTFPVLWGIALLRLLVPFSVASVFSVYTLMGLGRQETARDQEAYVVSGETEAMASLPDRDSGQHPAWGELSLRGQETAAAAAGNRVEILPAVWCAGGPGLRLVFLKVICPEPGQIPESGACGVGTGAAMDGETPERAACFGQTGGRDFDAFDLWVLPACHPAARKGP